MFYNSNKVSRQMPGMKDFTSVKTTGNSQIHMTVLGCYYNKAG
jgi:hypothetical protein